MTYAIYVYRPWERRWCCPFNPKIKKYITCIPIIALSVRQIKSVKMDSFFVHLQSDASWQHYSNNKRTNYRNHLAMPINVEANEYEVALCELSYTYNIPYIKKQTVLYKVRTVNEKEGKPSIEVVQYPEISKIKGPDKRTTSRNVNKSI